MRPGLKIADVEQGLEQKKKKLREKLETLDLVDINSNDKCSPFVLNVSVKNIKPEVLLHALEQHEVYISTQTACASNTALSKAVLALTKSEERARTSIRISLSYKTTEQEIDEFFDIFCSCVESLNLRG